MAKRDSSFKDSRTATRFAAVQALFSLDSNPGIDPTSLIEDFIAERSGDNIDGFQLGRLNRTLFKSIVKNTWEQRQDLDDMLQGVLPEGWMCEKMDAVFRAICRTGLYELSDTREPKVAVIINEYVEIAKDFFEGKEPGLVNALLDNLSRSLHPEVFEK